MNSNPRLTRGIGHKHIRVDFNAVALDLVIPVPRWQELWVVREEILHAPSEGIQSILPHVVTEHHNVRREA